MCVLETGKKTYLGGPRAIVLFGPQKYVRIIRAFRHQNIKTEMYYYFYFTDIIMSIPCSPETGLVNITALPLHTLCIASPMKERCGGYQKYNGRLSEVGGASTGNKHGSNKQSTASSKFCKCQTTLLRWQKIYNIMNP